MKKIYLISAVIATFMLGSCNEKAKDVEPPSTNTDPSEQVNVTVDFNSFCARHQKCQRRNKE